MFTVAVESKYTSSVRQLDSTASVAQLRGKLEQITGIPPSAQQWVVSLPSGHFINATFEAQKQLGLYIPAGINTFTLRVEDSRPENEQFTIDESVEKYEMSDLKYEQRHDSVLEWKKRNQLGRFASESPKPEQTPETIAASVGDRVSVTLKSGKTPNGTIRFVGKISEIPGDGIWVGVDLDSAEGKNEGSIKGRRYFECAAQHGVFVKPSAIEDPIEASDDEI